MKSPTENSTEARTGTFAGYFRSSLIAAGIALVIYLAIFALTTGGLDLATGLVIAGITFAVTLIVSMVVGAVARQRRHE